MENRFPYTDPTLYNAGGDITKEWYVQFNFLNPDTGKYERIKRTFNLNREKNPERKRFLFKEALDFMKDNLQRGYDPFLEDKLMREGLTEAGSEQAKGVEAIVQQVVDAMVVVATQNAAQTYRGMFNRLKKFLAFKQYQDLPLPLFDVEKCYELQVYLKDEMKLAKKTVNSTTSHIGMFWDHAIIRKAVHASNPFRDLKPVKNKDYRGKQKSGKNDHDFVPLTADEMDKVIEHYNKIEAKHFLRFLGMIYYAWIRPVEVTRLRIADIDLQHRSIRFLKENTKDNEYAHVQIVDELYQMLKEMDLRNYPSSYYLFSTDFAPGETQLDAWRNVTNKWWTPHVVKTLGIPKKMYAIKHTGNIEYILKNKGNVDVKWQQMQNRHGSTAITETYIKKLGVYFVDIEQFKFRSFI